LYLNETEVFVHIKSDYYICENLFFHILSLFQWGELHRDQWKTIRFSSELNGLLLQSRDITEISNHIRHEVIVLDHKSLEESLAHFWDPFNHKHERKMFTYRYNLLTKNKENQTHCQDTMDLDYLRKEEKFDWRCEGYMLSPCPPIVQELQYRTIPSIDVPLDLKMRNILLNRIGLKIIISKGLLINSCSVLCASRDLVCVPKAFHFVNNCELLQSFFGKKRCSNFVYGNPSYYPGYHWFVREINTLTKMVSDCGKTIGGYRRACVCGNMKEKKFKFRVKSVLDYYHSQGR
jgi:hypothetical protein